MIGQSLIGASDFTPHQFTLAAIRLVITSSQDGSSREDCCKPGYWLLPLVAANKHRFHGCAVYLLHPLISRSRHFLLLHNTCGPFLLSFCAYTPLKMKIACLQFAPEMGKVQDNIQRADAILQRTTIPSNLDWLVLPELSFTG
jgi:hypothetical protein